MYTAVFGGIHLYSHVQCGLCTSSGVGGLWGLAQSSAGALFSAPSEEVSSLSCCYPTLPNEPLTQLPQRSTPIGEGGMPPYSGWGAYCPGGTARTSPIQGAWRVAHGMSGAPPVG
eukprot:scaffold618_cov372-Prasinococcus_capsulatus_cf.AAC.14